MVTVPRVLAVDDDPTVLMVTVEVLMSMGYEVHEATSARQALDILSQDADWRLLVTDIRMPGGIDGWGLGKAALNIIAGLCVVYVSGYTDVRPELTKRERFVTKPWQVEQLENAVQSFGI